VAAVEEEGWNPYVDEDIMGDEPAAKYQATPQALIGKASGAALLGGLTASPPQAGSAATSSASGSLAAAGAILNAGGAGVAAGDAAGAAGNVALVAQAAPPLANAPVAPAPGAAAAAILGAGILGMQGPPAAPAGNDGDVKTLLGQLARWVATLESTCYDNLLLPEQHAVVVLGLEAFARWQAATKASPQAHGLGGSEGLTIVGLLTGLCQHVAQPTYAIEDGVKPKVAIAALLGSLVASSPPSANCSVISKATVAKLGGGKKGQAVVCIGIEGTCHLPDAAQVAEVAAALQHLAATGEWKQLHTILIRGELIMIDSGMMVAPGTAGKPTFRIQKVVTAALCSLGATRPPGRSPPSALEYRVGKGKGKGKGKA